MSYVRFGSDSDVYVIDAGDGFVCYCGEGFVCHRRSEMIEHLLRHRRDGDAVPQYAIERLREEIEVMGDEWEEE